MTDNDHIGEVEPFLTAVEVARILKVKPVTVHAAAADGRIPCVRVWQGKKRSLLRFRSSDIRSLVLGDAATSHGI